MLDLYSRSSWPQYLEYQFGYLLLYFDNFGNVCMPWTLKCIWLWLWEGYKSNYTFVNLLLDRRFLIFRSVHFSIALCPWSVCHLIIKLSACPVLWVTLNTYSCNVCRHRPTESLDDVVSVICPTILGILVRQSQRIIQIYWIRRPWGTFVPLTRYIQQVLFTLIHSE